MQYRTLLLLSIFFLNHILFSIPVSAGNLPEYFCGITAAKPGSDLFVNCVLEDTVSESVLTRLSQEVYKDMGGDRYGVIIIDWNYNVENIDNSPWASSQFFNKTLTLVKIRQDLENNYVRYKLFLKNIQMDVQ